MIEHSVGSLSRCQTIAALVASAMWRWYGDPWPGRTSSVSSALRSSRLARSDASGVSDFGAIDELWSEGGTAHIGGEFGQVMIREVKCSATYLDRKSSS